MKKTILACSPCLALFAGIIFILASAANAANVSFKADNFRRGEQNGAWTVLFDLTATNNGNDVVTKIYDLSFHMVATATDMDSGKDYILEADSSFSAPQRFAKLNLSAGASVKGSFAVPYVKFKGNWRWVGEEKHEDFILADVKVSDIKAMSDPGGGSIGFNLEDFLELCFSGTLQELETAINNGADIQAETFEGYTPLIVTINSSNLDKVRLMLKNGANPNDRSHSGVSALMNACDSKNPVEMVSLLLDNGADINAQDPSGKETVLMYAVEYAPSQELISLLLDRGADPNLTNSDNKTALDIAAGNESLKGTEAYRRLESMTKGSSGRKSGASFTSLFKRSSGPGKKTALSSNVGDTQQNQFSAAQLKLMSTFLSNFTEQGMYDFVAANLSNDELISFGIWHNFINNYKSRIQQCQSNDCPVRQGSLVIDAKWVTESIKKYFALDFNKHADVNTEFENYHFDGKLYHFEGASGEAVYYARVDKANRDVSGNIQMFGELYNVDDKTDKLGTFEAMAKPYKYGGKNTWSIISLKHVMD
jgi:hypothetical protein